MQKLEWEEKPIWGVKAIAEVIGRSQRQTFYMLEKGLLPGEKIGKSWVSNLKKLRSCFEGDNTQRSSQQ